ncbi:hypothetical protein BLOT_012438 [Blomia tropicalis]|nr:hypothetical protein BLOT_012438 [Blomia tropicalis]
MELLSSSHIAPIVVEFMGTSPKIHIIISSSTTKMTAPFVMSTMTMFIFILGILTYASIYIYMEHDQPNNEPSKHTIDTIV